MRDDQKRNRELIEEYASSYGLQKRDATDTNSVAI